MSDKRIGVAKVIKLDTYTEGRIINSSKRGLWLEDDVIDNIRLGTYLSGTILNITIRVDGEGKREIGKIEIAKESPIKFPVPDKKLETYTESLPEKEHLPKVPASNSSAPSLAGYHISHEARSVFSTAKKLSDAHPERAVKLMMVGPSGYGKTTLPRLFAEVTGKSFMRMNCASIRDPEEWFGYREARDGNTVFIRSELIKALEAGNLVLILDEFNRLEPWLHNTLYPLLDDDGCTVVHGEEFRIGPGVIVVGTINTGYRYTGTFELDEALLNRFEFVLEVGPMLQAEETNVLVARTGLELGRVKEVVRVATILRQLEVACSTRTTLAICNLMVSGMTLRESFEWAIVRRIPADTSGSGLRKQVIDRLNSAVGVLEQRKLSFDVFSTGEPLQDSQAETVDEEIVNGISLTLKRKDKVSTWLRVQIIQQLRSIPHVLGAEESEGEYLSLRMAQDIVKRIEEGEVVTLEIMKDSTETKEIVTRAIQSLEKYGIASTYSV
jgi:hypothetical protein